MTSVAVQLWHSGMGMMQASVRACCWMVTRADCRAAVGGTARCPCGWPSTPASTTVPISHPTRGAGPSSGPPSTELLGMEAAAWQTAHAKLAPRSASAAVQGACQEELSLGLRPPAHWKVPPLKHCTLEGAVLVGVGSHAEKPLAGCGPVVLSTRHASPSTPVAAGPRPCLGGLPVAAMHMSTPR